MTKVSEFCRLGVMTLTLSPMEVEALKARKSYRKNVALVRCAAGHEAHLMPWCESLPERCVAPKCPEKMQEVAR